MLVQLQQLVIQLLTHISAGTAGASIPYCENIIGVIDHVPISQMVAAENNTLTSKSDFIGNRKNKFAKVCRCHSGIT